MKTYGLIGRKLSHSFSRPFFQEKFQNENIDAQYLNFEIDSIDEIGAILEQKPAGLNVTIPFKTEIMSIIDEIDSEADLIGAVNTIAFREGKTIGYNTDAYGFHNSIKPFLASHHERALIIGQGGASKAVSYVLSKLGVEVLYAAREPKGDKSFLLSEINENAIRYCPLIVNTTPVGQYPNIEEELPLPLQYLSKNHLVIDLIYNPEKTQLLRVAESKGAMILNGLPMLRHQALKAWEIWGKEC